MNWKSRLNLAQFQMNLPTGASLVQISTFSVRVGGWEDYWRLRLNSAQFQLKLPTGVELGNKNLSRSGWPDLRLVIYPFIIFFKVEDTIYLKFNCLPDFPKPPSNTPHAVYNAMIRISHIISDLKILGLPYLTLIYSVFNHTGPHKHSEVIQIKNVHKLVTGCFLLSFSGHT